MNLAETFRGLLRRWYIVAPGILLAVIAGVVTWSMTKPAYERTATQILLPGKGTLPEEATNPYLYLGGLPSAADVIVRAVGSEEALRDLIDANPGAEVEVTRDPSTSGPVILVTVTAGSDAAAEEMITELVERTATTLADLQTAQGVADADRITVTPIAVDDVSRLQQRDRIVLSAGVAAGLVLLSLILGSAVDGLVSRSRRDGRGRTDGQDGDEDALVYGDDPAAFHAGAERAEEDEPDGAHDPRATQPAAADAAEGTTPDAESIRASAHDDADADADASLDPEADAGSDAEPDAEEAAPAQPVADEPRTVPRRPARSGGHRTAVPVGAARHI